MSRTLEQLADRLDIQDAIIRYSTAIDFGDWGLLDRVFTEDAICDYRPAWGILANSRKEFRDWMKSHWDTHIIGQQHHMSPPAFIELTDTSAHTQTYGHAVLTVSRDDQVLLHHLGARYMDNLKKMPDGWLIYKRTSEMLWCNFTDAQPVGFWTEATPKGPWNSAELPMGEWDPHLWTVRGRG